MNKKTHNKIDELLNNLRNANKKPKVVEQEVDSYIEKSYSAKDISDRKNKPRKKNEW